MKKYNIQNYVRYKEDLKTSICNLEGKFYDEYTRDELIIKFMPLVENLARKFATSQQASGVLSINDLIQEGNYGLVKAVDKIDWLMIDESPDVEKTLKSFLSKRIITKLQTLIPSSPIQSGNVDISFYRDDLMRRDEPIVPEVMDMNLSVEGKNVVLVDDMVDTAGTLTKAADLMMERGALSVRAVCTHPILSGFAYDKIENSKLEELIVTDSIPSKKESSKIKILSCADLFAEVMTNVNSNKSISTKFLM